MTAGPSRSILAISGSLRRNGYNHWLLQCAALSAPAGIHLDVYDALSHVPLFDEDMEAATQGGPDAVYRLRAAVDAADGVLIATPEYNQSIPGVLKNAIDWLSRPAPELVLRGKPVAIIGATQGRWGTRLAQAALRQTLAATESLIMPSPMLFVGNAESQFDYKGHLRDASTQQSLCTFMNAFAQWLDYVEPRPVRGVA